MQRFKEGEVTFFAEDNQTKKAGVFFNPSRRFDRDLNVSLIKALSAKDIVGIDLFAASGVRGLRLAKETGAFTSIIINDIKTSHTIKKNITLNHIKRTKLIQTCINAANVNSLEDGFDYIDIDPFGSPVRFLASAIQKLRYGGTLAITATDSAPLYGRAPKACILKYGAVSLKTSYYNEVGLRILIKRAEEIANIYGRSLEPILFDVRRHYLRVYLKVRKPDSSRPIGYIFQCKHCPYRLTEGYGEKCPVCGSNLVRIGPLWMGKLFSNELMPNISAFSVSSEVKSYVENLANEEHIISYYTTNELSSYLKTKEIPINGLGSRTVFDPKGFRTKKALNEIIEDWKSLLARF